MFYDQFDILCKKNNTTPTEFTTKILKLSSSKVTAWKNGSIPKYGILKSIADYFNVTVGYLFDGELQKNAPTDIGEGDEKKNRLISNYDKLNAEGQEKLVGYSDDLVDTKKYVKSNAGADKVGA